MEIQASPGGGGISCREYSSPTITNCMISDNRAITFGGGVHCSSSEPTITSCTISGNIADSGGGIFCYNLAHSMGYFFPRITNCTISGNIAERYGGGGIRCDNSSTTITNCTISGNSAEVDGGGIVCSRDFYEITNFMITLNSFPIITNCMITGNSTNNDGGGIYCYYINPTITNCIISGNSADNDGGGIHCTVHSSPLITNCTISENSATGTYSKGGGIYSGRSSPMITNSIFWEDSATLGPEIYIGFSSAITVSYSDVQGGEAAAFVRPGGTLHWEDANIDSDPLFVGEGDYHLTLGSPCIDAGTDAGIYTDMDGEVRPQGAEFDMGVDEFSTEPCSIIASSGNQFFAVFLLPALALFFFRRRFLRR